MRADLDGYRVRARCRCAAAAGAGTIPVADAAQTLASFGPPSSGSTAARVEDILTAIGASAGALEDELDVLGTSADEQEVATFGSGPPPASAADLLLASIGGLMPGRRYTLTFAFSSQAQPLIPGAYREFPVDAPVRDTGSPATQRLVIADFTSGLRSASRQFILIGRPDSIPDDFFLAQINLSPTAVPEPATWAMMLLGFGASGFGMRHRPSLNLATST